MYFYENVFFFLTINMLTNKMYNLKKKIYISNFFVMVTVFIICKQTFKNLKKHMPR